MFRILFPTLFVGCICYVVTETRCLATDTVRTPPSLQREGITLSGGDGSSFEKAIIIHAHDEKRAILAEYEYMLLHYRALQLISLVRVRYNGKHYDVLTYYENCEVCRTPNWRKRAFYFDMSNYYGKRPHASNQSMKPTPKAFVSRLSPFDNKFSVFATAPCRGLSPSR